MNESSQNFLGENYKFLSNVLKIIGCWPFYTTTLQNHLQTLRTTVQLTITFLILTCEFAYMLNESNISLFDIIENISLALTVWISIIKIFTHVQNKQKLITICEHIKDLHQNTPIPDNQTIQILTETVFKRSDFLSKYLFSTCFGCITVYVGRPWVVYYKKGVLTLPYLIKVPFDLDSFQNYLPLYFLQLIGSIGVTLIFTCDTLFSSIVLYICTRIEVLKFALDESVEEAQKKGKQGELFMKCVEYHKKILRICTIMEQYFSRILVTQFLSNTVLICLLCFLGTQDTELMDKSFQFFLYFVSILGQLFIFCFFGQLLETKFQWLNNEIFHCYWYNTPIICQKNYQFLILKTSRNNTLKAYNFIPCNLAIFHMVVKTSLSYYTLLLSMKNE